MFRIHSQIGRFHAADLSSTATQPLHEKIFDRTIQTNINSTRRFSTNFTVEKFVRQQRSDIYLVYISIIFISSSLLLFLYASIQIGPSANKELMENVKNAKK